MTSARNSDLHDRLETVAEEMPISDPGLAYEQIQSQGRRIRRRSRSAAVLVTGLAAALAGGLFTTLPGSKTSSAQPQPVHYLLTGGTPSSLPPIGSVPPVLPPPILNGPASQQLAAQMASKLPGYTAVRLEDQTVDCGTAASVNFMNSVHDLVIVQTQCLSHPVMAASLAQTGEFTLSDRPNGDQVLTSTAAPGNRTGGFTLVIKTDSTGRLAQLSAYGPEGNKAPFAADKATSLLP